MYNSFRKNREVRKLNKDSKRGYSAKELALCSLLAALGAVIMLSGGLIPVFTYCSPLLASCLLVPVIREYGRGRACAVWAVTGLLSLLIGADKEAAFFYVFLGLYPVLRLPLNRIQPPRILAKFTLALLLTLAMYGFTCFVLGLEEIIEGFAAAMWLNAVFFVMMALTVLIFDVLLSRLELVWEYRLRPRLLSKGGDK